MQVMPRPMMKFTHLVLNGMKPTDAAVASGYPARRASGLMRARSVKEMMQAEHAVLRKRHNMDRNRLAVMLLKAYHSASTATEMVAAVRELAKLYGLYPKPRSTENVVRRASDFEKMSDEELREIAGC